MYTADMAAFFAVLLLVLIGALAFVLVSRRMSRSSSQGGSAATTFRGRGDDVTRSTWALAASSSSSTDRARARRKLALGPEDQQVYVIAVQNCARRSGGSGGADADAACSDRNVNDNLEGFVNPLPAYVDEVRGPVGEKGILNAQGQETVRNAINRINRPGETCAPRGQAMPDEWRPVADQADDAGGPVCSLQLTSHVVRNNCSQDNRTLFPEGGIVEQAYIDPNTHRCHVKFAPGIDAAQVQRYSSQVDIDAQLARLEDLQAQVARLENERAEAENTLQDLRRTWRSNEEDIDDLQTAVRELEQKIDDMRAELDTARAEKQQAQRRLSEMRGRLGTALSGVKINFALDGRVWRVDSGGRIRLKRGSPLCLTVIGDDARVHGHAKGMVAFFADEDETRAVRHRGMTMYTEPLNRGPDYDFAYKVVYDGDGVYLENDYGGTSYVGYDEDTDTVRIFRDSADRRKWNVESPCGAQSEIARIGPASPRALSGGGWCCTHNGIRMKALDACSLGKCKVEANRAGRIVVRLSDDADKTGSHFYTREYDVRQGTQEVRLDMDLVAGQRYFLWHDRDSSPNSDVQLYRADDPSDVPNFLRTYAGTLAVLNMQNAALGNTWKRYWYSFFDVQLLRASPALRTSSASGMSQFTTPGKHRVTVPASPAVRVLVVGGGGGGGGAHDTNASGGGGGGGVVTKSFSSSRARTFDVVVGAGGKRGDNEYDSGTNGGDSYFGQVRAVGGGKGGSRRSGADGGSGGGADTLPKDGSDEGGDGVSGQGRDGGSSGTSYGGGGGGGGGAGGEGGSGRTVFGGDGGAGTSSDITGSSVYYGGGGGGASHRNAAGGKGGRGGGGDAGTQDADGKDGAENTGGGGGAAKRNRRAGDGGSGIVVVKYGSA